MNFKVKIGYCFFALLLTYYSELAFSSVNEYYFVSAATSGIGSVVCETLAARGHNLILAGRNQEKLEALKLRLEKKPKYKKIKLDILLFDYDDFNSLEKIGNLVANKKINGLVIIPARPQISSNQMPTAEQWMKMLKMSFVGALELVNQTLPVLQTESSIVIIDGITSEYYIPNYANSNVLRKMWVGEVKNLTFLLKNRKIRSNVISPGVTLTQFQIDKIQAKAKAANKTYEAQLEEDTQDVPLHRFAEPIDVANAVEFLLSDKSKNINGINLVIDGGLSKAY